MLKIPTFALGIAVLLLGLAACGGSSATSSTSSSASSTTTSAPAASASTPSTPAASSGDTGALTLAADPGGQLKFTNSSLTAKAGKVTIQFTNSAPLSHNLTIQQGANGATVGATPTFQGGSKTVIVNLKPGTYTFFCGVPGHQAAGMQGTLTVS